MGKEAFSELPLKEGNLQVDAYRDEEKEIESKIKL